MTLRMLRRERLALVNRLRVNHIYTFRGVVTRLLHRSSDATPSAQTAHGPDLRVLCCSSSGRAPPHPRPPLLIRKEHHALSQRRKAFDIPVASVFSL